MMKKACFCFAFTTFHSSREACIAKGAAIQNLDTRYGRERSEGEKKKPRKAQDASMRTLRLRGGENLNDSKK